MADAATVIVGGTSGLGLDLAAACIERGHRVVIAGRDAGRSAEAAGRLGPRATGIALDLSRPESIAAGLGQVGEVRHLALTAIEHGEHTVTDFVPADALRLTTLKLIGYPEVVHQLLPRMGDDGAIVIYGGQAYIRPYPGSTTVSTVNGGVLGLVNSLAVELGPIRVNGIHPGVIGDSPIWVDQPAEVLEAFVERTPIGRPVTMREVSEAALFLLGNRAVSGVNLAVDGGWIRR